MKRWIAAILLLCMILCLFTGCEKWIRSRQEKVDAIEKIPYELDQEMVDDFYALLEESEELCKTTEDIDAANESIDLLDDAYLNLIDQYQIAYINYCLDQTDEEQKQQYLDCVDITTEAETAYNDMCKRVYLSDTPIRDALFEDWTQQEIDMMLKRNDEIAKLEKRNTEITVEYRDLEEDDAWEENMVELYNELVENNNRIAQIYGFENYYVYAYEMIYQRDYEPEQILNMRQYVAQYLPETFDLAMESFSDVYYGLDFEEQELVSDLMYEPYDQLDENYAMDYIASMPSEARKGMMDMFESDRAVFTSYKNAYEGAFTTWIGKKPFCFYGNGYTNTLTLIHELGHYYGCSFVEPWSQPMDLSETQSQGNEWLFIRSLKEQASQGVYETMVEYKLLSDIGNLVCFVMIDEFEQRVYSSEHAGNMTVAEYDAIMEDIAVTYGGIDYICENMMDVQLYWKYVVLESPVYYISYAVSGVAAVNLFTIAEENPEKAHSIYITLIEDPLEEEGFLGNIQHAGLAGPFEETVYQQLYERYAK